MCQAEFSILRLYSVLIAPRSVDIDACLGEGYRIVRSSWDAVHVFLLYIIVDHTVNFSYLILAS